MLEITNCHVSVEGKAIIRGLNLSVPAGEVHAIMGPNGSGKSTLSAAIAGKPGYEVTQGDIICCGQSLLELSPEERATLGVFLGFQYPVEIPGVNNSYFLRMATNEHRRCRGLDQYDAFDFLSVLREKLALLEIKESFLERSLNEGFSGGEKKRNEILQMLMLQPKLAILDETDSGLDIDALKVVAKGVNSMRDKQRSIVMITHYQRLLDYIKPDVVHVMVEGAIVETGDVRLAEKLERDGYAWVSGE